MGSCSNHLRIFSRYGTMALVYFPFYIIFPLVGSRFLHNGRRTAGSFQCFYFNYNWFSVNTFVNICFLTQSKCNFLHLLIQRQLLYNGLGRRWYGIFLTLPHKCDMFMREFSEFRRIIKCILIVFYLWGQSSP